MKRFEKQELNRRDYKLMEILADIVRVMLFPVFLLVRIYCWVFDYDYLERFSR